MDDRFRPCFVTLIPLMSLPWPHVVWYYQTELSEKDFHLGDRQFVAEYAFFSFLKSYSNF